MIKKRAHIDELKMYQAGRSVSDDQVRAHLASNENHLGPSPKALAAIQERLSTVAQYPDPFSEPLRSEIARYNKVEKENIMVLNGSDTFFGLMFQTFFEKEDEILTSKGTFQTVYLAADRARVSCWQEPMVEYAFNLDAIEEQVSKLTKAIYLCNPNNPTGTVLSKRQLLDFVDRVPAHVLLVIDEAYSEYAINSGLDFGSVAYEGLINVVTLRTFSKAFGLGGLRVGYAIANPEVIAALNKIQNVFEVNQLGIYGAMAALDDVPHLESTLELNHKVLLDYYDCFEKLKISYIPSGGNFVFFHLNSKQEVQSCIRYLAKKGIKVRSGEIFGFPNSIRVSTGSEQASSFFVKELSNWKEGIV